MTVEPTNVQSPQGREHSADLTFLLEGDGTIRHASRSTDRVLGYAAGEVVGRSIQELIHEDDRDRATSIELWQPEGEKGPEVIELRLQHRNGSWCSLEVAATDMLDDPTTNGVIMHMRNLHDSADSADLHESIQNLIVASAIEGERVAILALDLDGFRSINEDLGHDAADRLLADVATRVQATLRPGDFVIRVGGDEFIVAVGEVVEASDAIAAASRILGAVKHELQVGTNSTTVSASIGVSIASGRETISELIEQAETALRQSKSKGPDRLELYDSGLSRPAERRLSLEQELRQTLARGNFDVFYQPTVELATDTIVGAEALIRLPQGDGSFQSPAEFIGIAEQTGLIMDLGRQVLARACQQVADWGPEPGVPAPIEMAVNVSAFQLTDPAFAAWAVNEITAAAIHTEQLGLELNETAMIANDPAMQENLARLRQLGIRIGLDDFGASDSSMAHLRAHPVDYLKIDKSFVEGLGGGGDADDASIVRATVALAHTLDLTVIGEGVETRDQLDFLRRLQCDRAQGFYLSRPLSSEEFGRMLQRGAQPAPGHAPFWRERAGNGAG